VIDKLGSPLSAAEPATPTSRSAIGGIGAVRSARTRIAAIGSLVRRPLAITFATSGVIQVLNVLTGVSLARGLGPHARGEVAAILLWVILVASAGQFGIADAVTYYVANDRREARQVIGVALGAGLVLSLGLVAVGAVVVRLTLSHYGSTTLTMGYISLALIPLYVGTSITTSALQGLEAMTSFNVVRALVNIATAVGLLTFYALDALTVSTATWCYIAGYAVPFFVSLAPLQRKGAFGFGFERRMLGRLFAYGIRSQTAFITQTLIQRLDQLLISILLGATSLGIYVVAVTLTSGANLIASTVGLVAFPRVAAIVDGAERLAQARRYLVIATVLSVLLVVPMLLFTPQLLDLFFGHSFVKGTGVCRVLLVASLFLAFTFLLTSLLRGLGRPLDVGIAGVVGLAITVVLLAALLPTMGLMGAAIASLVSYAVTAGLMLARVSDALNVSIAQFVLGSSRSRPLRLEEAQ
jgi:O-antigen/teichoic acid export membrane protein